MNGFDKVTSSQKHIDNAPKAPRTAGIPIHQATSSYLVLLLVVPCLLHCLTLLRLPAVLLVGFSLECSSYCLSFGGIFGRLEMSTPPRLGFPRLGFSHSIEQAHHASAAATYKTRCYRGHPLAMLTTVHRLLATRRVARAPQSVNKAVNLTTLSQH